MRADAFSHHRPQQFESVDFADVKIGAESGISDNRIFKFKACGLKNNIEINAISKSDVINEIISDI